MSIEIKVPPLGESVSEATIARWIKSAGEAVALDEPVAELETDKVTLEVPAPAAGVISSITADVGATVGIDAVIALIDEGATASAAPAASAPETKPQDAPPAATSAPAPALHRRQQIQTTRYRRRSNVWWKKTISTRNRFLLQVKMAA